MHTLILGFDSFDPFTFEKLAGEGKLPNLARFAEAGGYARFEVSTPPQTEVSWTSIATGLTPGGHGIFDFVHRDPGSYTPYVSLLPTRKELFGLQFSPPYTARTIFEEATRLGYPATALWWPALFPARPELPVRTIPGLGTPDLHGKLGVGMLFTNDAARLGSLEKTGVQVLVERGRDRYQGSFAGPLRRKGSQVQAATLDFTLEIRDDQTARLQVDQLSLDLQLGQWSPIVELSFKLGLLISVRAITRLILTHTKPEVRLYALPLQIHPLHTPWRYATPGTFVRQAWKASGPFLTLGWPQDTTGLEEGCLSDEQFLALCRTISASREHLLMHQLQGFSEGLLAIVFDDLDRVQHMFRRDRPEVIEDWYVHLDNLVGRVGQRLKEIGRKGMKVFVLSDHGFTDFTYKVHLNRWLNEHGFLAHKNGANQTQGGLQEVDWSRSQAYAIGLNSLYLNRRGREGQGILDDQQAEAARQQLLSQLTEWQGPDGQPVFKKVWKSEEVFSGPLTPYGPDLVLGYTPGYRASSETGLGKWAEDAIEPNQDHWGADHCIEASCVPGVIFANRDLSGFQKLSFRDIPYLTIGKPLDPAYSEPPSFPKDGESQAILEERLKSLGYL